MNKLMKTALLAAGFVVLSVPALRSSVSATADRIGAGAPGLHRESPGGGPRRGEHERMTPPGFYREERFIKYLYRGFLAREPGPEEVRGWSRKMDAGQVPGDLVRDFLNSDEFYIRQCYIGLLGRNPDPDGMNNSAQFLRNGGSREDMVESILTSPEFRQRLR